MFSKALTGSRAHPGEPVGLVNGLGGVDGLRRGFWGGWLCFAFELLLLFALLVLGLWSPESGRVQGAHLRERSPPHYYYVVVYSNTTMHRHRILVARGTLVPLYYRGIL